jgi:hypothetical protein
MQETADALTVLQRFDYRRLQRLHLGVFYEPHARSGTVMAVASPWRPPLGQTRNFLQLADHGFDCFPGNASGAQDDRWGTGYIKHCRFEANAR